MRQFAALIHGYGTYPDEELHALVEPFERQYELEIFTPGNGADGGFDHLILVLSAIGVTTAAGWTIKPFLEESAKEFAKRFAAFAEKHWPIPRRPDQYLTIRIAPPKDPPPGLYPDVFLEVKVDLQTSDIEQVLSDVERVWRRITLSLASLPSSPKKSFLAVQNEDARPSQIEAQVIIDQPKGGFKIVNYAAVLDDGDGPLTWVEAQSNLQ